ncbi:MAG: universal stress protein [Chloracidobacterium sp.]|nr:universal stress protein [Chloracidobacterium sp.]
MGRQKRARRRRSMRRPSGSSLERPPGLRSSQEVKDGHPKDVILDEAEKWGADLIVLGSHGYNGWERFLLRSVSHAVASHTHCSVEIVGKNRRRKNRWRR